MEANSAAVAARFHIWFGEQVGVHWDASGSWNNTHGIATTSVNQLAAQALAGRC